MLKKRGYFFMLDATLGLFVLVIGVVLVLSFYVNVPAPGQISLISNVILIPAIKLKFPTLKKSALLAKRASAKNIDTTVCTRAV